MSSDKQLVRRWERHRGTQPIADISVKESAWTLRVARMTHLEELFNALEDDGEERDPEADQLLDRLRGRLADNRSSLNHAEMWRGDHDEIHMRLVDLVVDIRADVMAASRPTFYKYVNAYPLEYGDNEAWIEAIRRAALRAQMSREELLELVGHSAAEIRGIGLELMRNA